MKELNLIKTKLAGLHDEHTSIQSDNIRIKNKLNEMKTIVEVVKRKVK
jgi:hypothetical protein